MAHEIVERIPQGEGRCSWWACAPAACLSGPAAVRRAGRRRGRRKPTLGAVDITLYRDDVFSGLPKPEIGPTELPEPIDGRTIVLVDDVLYTGRTIRAALDVLVDYGRPRAVKLAALVDRGRRELPIQPDYVGLAVQTTARESVRVHARASAASPTASCCGSGRA